MCTRHCFLEFILFFDSTGNNSFTVVTFGNKIFDREEIPEFNLVIDISDEGGNTAANVLPIQVKDKNDNPHHPVIKNMLVYAFEGKPPTPPPKKKQKRKKPKQSINLWLSDSVLSCSVYTH